MTEGSVGQMVASRDEGNARAGETWILELEGKEGIAPFGTEQGEMRIVAAMERTEVVKQQKR